MSGDSKRNNFEHRIEESIVLSNIFPEMGKKNIVDLLHNKSQIHSGAKVMLLHSKENNSNGAIVIFTSNSMSIDELSNLKLSKIGSSRNNLTIHI